jgi:hypothetical protein
LIENIESVRRLANEYTEMVLHTEGMKFRRRTLTLRSRQMEQPFEGLPQYTMVDHSSGGGDV